MACKICDNNEVTGYSYCGEHLCTKITNENIRCKKSKIRNSHFCYIHHYFVNKSTTFFNILVILSFLFGAYMLPPVQNYFHGQLKIDFKENDLSFNERGEPSVKIEVINRLGKDLYFVNGTSTLVCENLDREITSKTFKLKGGYDFLPSGDNVEFLLSPDPFFVDLVKSRNNTCVDAYFYSAEYNKINFSYAKLVKIHAFDIYYTEPKHYKIVNLTFGNTKNTTNFRCIKCKVITNISSSNYKTISVNETHKFVAGFISIPPFKELIKIEKPQETAEVFYEGKVGYHSNFPLNDYGLCIFITKNFKIGILCDQILSRSTSEQEAFSEIK